MDSQSKALSDITGQLEDILVTSLSGHSIEMELQIKLLSTIVIFFAIVDARASYSYLNNRPVIDLNDKPKPTALKLPYERRSSIFPKAHLRFVSATTEPEKVSLRATKEKPTHNPLEQTINLRPKEKEMKVAENIVRSKLSDLTPKIVEINTPQNKLVRNRAKTIELESMNINQPIENSFRNDGNAGTKAENEDNLSFKINRRNRINMPMITTELESTKNNLPIENDFINYKYENDSKLPIQRNQRKRVNTSAITSELDSTNINLPIENASVTNSNARETENDSDLRIRGNQRRRVFTSATSDTDDGLKQKENIMPEQIYEAQVNDYFSTLKLPTSVSSNENRYEGIIVAGRNERNNEPRWTRNRRIRSVNIIEEENMGTTIQSGFQFTGREPRVISHQGFRNINS